MSKKNINVENQSADEITKKDNDVEVIENQLNDLGSTISSSNDETNEQSADEITKKDNDVEVIENQLNDLGSTISSSNDETNEQSADEITKRYVVVHKFMDLEDSNHIYRINDIYPRENIDEKTKINALSESRITALMTTNNKIGEILIKLDEE